MVLVRLVRQADVGLGQRLEKECYGMKLLVVRHPTSGSVSVIDAHCFHMGTALAGGDIEDLDGHSCIVCPAHRYRIDLATGCKVDTDLEGRVCAGAEQKQRVYRVHADGEFLWVDLPDVRGPPLASDYYNCAQQQLPSSLQQPPAERPGSQNYGLFGAAPAGASAAAAGISTPVQPYSGYSGWPVIPAVRDQTAASPPLVLSQEAPRSPAPAARISFPAAKADPPHIARRKAATAAILQKSYRPPTADSTPMQSPAKPLAAAPAAQGARQQTLLEMAWAARPATTSGDAMDMS